MSKQRCDGCDRRVRLGGGIGDLWSFQTGSTDGLTLELADGSDHFLCYDCIESLPDDEEVTRAHIEALPTDGDDDGGSDDDDDTDERSDSDDADGSDVADDSDE